METTLIHDMISVSSQKHAALLLTSEHPVLSEDADDEKTKALEQCLLAEQSCESELAELGKNAKILSDIEKDYSLDELERAVAAKKKNAELRKKYDEVANLMTNHSMSIGEWRDKANKIQENHQLQTELNDLLGAMNIMLKSLVAEDQDME